MSEKPPDEEFWKQQYLNVPLIEKENPAGFTIAKDIRPATYTGFRFTEHGSFVAGPKAKQTYLLDWSWTTVPWYARALGLLRLPYDLTKFIITGRLFLIPWPWRW